MTARTVADLSWDDLGAWVEATDPDSGERVAGYLYGLHDGYGDGWRFRRLVLVPEDAGELDGSPVQEPEYDAFDLTGRPRPDALPVLVLDGPPEFPRAARAVAGLLPPVSPPCQPITLARRRAAR